MDHSISRPGFFRAPLEIAQYHSMPYQRIGNSGLWASRAGLGTWKFGYPESGDGARVDSKTAGQIFDRALELGVTFWDTAARAVAGQKNLFRADRSVGAKRPE